jgi:hypothetical protein
MVGCKHFIDESWRDHKPLVIAILFSLFCLGISVYGLIVDYKYIAGEHAWIKPTKFSISLAVYAFTLLWYSRFLTNHPRLLHRVAFASCAGTIVELTAIITQVLRGEASHFNQSTAFNHMMFGITIAAIVPICVSTIVLFAMVLRERSLPEVVRASLGWALFVTIIGFLPGILMILPDHLQDAITCYREVNGHTVGFAEGGRGIPYLGWSTVAGDLHFVGIHALQAIPLYGIAVSIAFSKLTAAKQKALVWIFSICYLSMVLLMTWQAVHAESSFAPSMTMRIAAAALVIFGSVASGSFMWLPYTGAWKLTTPRLRGDRS